MKKIILSIILILVLGTSIFVNAGYFMNEDEKHIVVKVTEGWNILVGFQDVNQIVSGYGIEKENIKAIYGFIPTTQEYIRAWPNPDGNEWMNLDNIYDDHEMLQTGFWVYLDKEGELNYNLIDEFTPVDGKKLYKGWNFFAPSPDIISKQEVIDGSTHFSDETPLSSIQGDCNLQSVYGFFDGKWGKESTDVFMTPDIFGYGILIKSGNDCTLGKSAEDLSPPSLPEEELEASKCDIGMPFRCNGFIVKPSGVQLSIEQNSGFDIEDVTLRISSCSNDVKYIPSWRNNDQEVFAFDCNIVTGQSYDETIDVSYTLTVTGIDHVVSGELVGIV